jgi:hypothetical protein
MGSAARIGENVMFVTKARYEKLEQEHAKLKEQLILLETREYDQSYAYYRVKDELHDLTAEHAKLIDRWNSLAERINAKGGQEFMDTAIMLPRDEIKSLLSLVHPDKHNGKESAVRWTQRLLELRDQG